MLLSVCQRTIVWTGTDGEESSMCDLLPLGDCELEERKNAEDGGGARQPLPNQLLDFSSLLHQLGIEPGAAHADKNTIFKKKYITNTDLQQLHVNMHNKGRTHDVANLRDAGVIVQFCLKPFCKE